MKSIEIREEFFRFFKDKAHQIVPSAPIVIKDDPTLMFTNAGMNQFKDFFLGNKEAPDTKVADTQKCLRVSGKHNDLEEVGIDTYHHTMFEMLGNWSFGDYFKKEAIAWSWELLTDRYKLPAEQIYVTVFEGDPSENLSFDQEAYDFWKAFLPEDRILHGNKADNFWEMGETGPCGPCSELHIDLRPVAERTQVPGKELVNQDHPQVIEIWNLVFMQYNRMADGTLKALPNTHVDTGMGFERLVMAIQGKTSNYDTDVFQPLIQEISKMSGKAYGEDEQTDIAIRVISDHIRAITFTIADGQLPSNNKAGYVIRRILRRAVRYGYTFLNLKEPFLYKLVSILAMQMGKTFPEVPSQQEFLERVIKEEESAFLRTLDKGLKRIDQLIAGLEPKGTVDGKVAFELYDTYGFPLDLTQLIAQEHGFGIDMPGFEQELAAQKNRARQAAAVDKGDWTELKSGEETEFTGYTSVIEQSSIIKYRAVLEKKKQFYQIVLDKTPFYAESGGQVGDTGYLITGEHKVRVFNTKKENDLIIHFTDQLPAEPHAALSAQVDAHRRQLTTANHSATHLMHAALREVLGDHVQQRGSLVNDKLLRFDFSHFAKMTDEELRQVEQRVNQKVRENVLADIQDHVPIEEAKSRGAMALFGEKYGDYVRVVTFDPTYSVELCGGIHVQSTGQIGSFKIISEGSVASGVRRIEAITAEAAEQHISAQLQLVEQLKELLKNPKDLTQAVTDLIDEKNQLSKELEALNKEKAAGVKEELRAKLQPMGSVQVLIEQVSLPDAAALKQLAFEFRNEVAQLFMVLAANIGGKPQVAVMIADELLDSYELHAGQLVKALAKSIQGGGGGQAFFATAGGKDADGLSQVVAEAKALAAAKFQG